ncbi:cell envelope integrity protein TolA [Erythrobacter sp. Alg231-14]|uniref:cell envelope integrity protein TolA n=1 Tax=Erythrobacter sp. Alg231-14 TaxID=1922225 RepID=UPI000D553534
MGETAFRFEERIGLIAAIVLHVALVVVLAMQFALFPPKDITPDRMTVSLATEVSLEATAPEPVAESRAAIAPTLSEEPAPPEEPAQVEPVETAPRPAPVPQTRPAPTPQTRPQTRPTNTSPPRPRTRPDRPRETTPAPRNTGGSRIGDNFLGGSGNSTNTDETRPPAATFGRRERAALASAITRQLRPNWNPPTGVDADKLVSTVSWRLNQDGTLRGTPTCRTQNNSITASNRPQVGLHCERAIRAVRSAVPFNLPEQFYSRWDDLEWQFDIRL